jgi:protocatechuate 3,4-dioxygenase beta subunit
MKIPSRSTPSHDHAHEALGSDLRRMASIVSRRQMLGLLAGATLLPVIGCGGTALSGTDAGNSNNDLGNTNGDGSTASGTCTKIPEETAGPYPGDGSNGKNVLTQSGVVRSDIRPSLSGSTVATGVLLTVKLTLVDVSNGCAPLANRAVYIWHCDMNGNYSMYSSAVANETYLRGVQVTDSNGQVTFTSIYPGCYSGRWPHIHFEIYSSVGEATAGANASATSQMAMPKATNDLVYATSGYGASATNQANITLASDNVFSDGASTQLGNMSGDTVGGYTAALTVGVGT